MRAKCVEKLPAYPGLRGPLYAFAPLHVRLHALDHTTLTDASRPSRSSLSGVCLPIEPIIEPLSTIVDELPGVLLTAPPSAPPLMIVSPICTPPRWAGDPASQAAHASRIQAVGRHDARLPTLVLRGSARLRDLG